MTASSHSAPGHPGGAAHWTAGAKTGVGTALSSDSSVWFTLGQGILNEVYYPSVDTACTRDLELLVTGPDGFFSEEKVDTTSQVSYLASGVPAFQLTNTCKQGRYRIEKTVLTDPHRSVVLQQTHLRALKGSLADYAAFVLLVPHVGNQGAGNTAWLGDYKGTPMLFASREGTTLALACSAPWRARSVGFVGESDGFQDISRHKRMTWAYQRAEDGNVALTAEVDLAAGSGAFLLALSFGRNEWEAGHRARASLMQGLDRARDDYVRSWSDWQKSLRPPEKPARHRPDLYRISAAVIRTHEGKDFPGSIIASLALPWGSARGDGDLGYHLVWPRDMIETVGALLAIEKHEDARRVLFYYQVTQDADGHWPQNMWADGAHYWNGVQLDETAFVVLLVELARREKALEAREVSSLWPMVRLAASYLVRNGPVTPLDRWEEESGYFASTMAVLVPALLVAADLADRCGEKDMGTYLRETADAWNDSIEGLLYVTNTDLAHRVGVEGYYVRFALPDQMAAPAPAHGFADLKNHAPGKGRHALTDIVSPDALTLVRFGLRAADDPRIVNTVRVLDAVLKVDTPAGPCWHRYSHDGYGEHADGSPFDGTGIGRAWPLLTGERAHYELAAGRRKEAEQLLHALEGFANESGLLPEQVWDSADLPERGLHPGRPSGSAMPLVWAHAEYVKLRRSLQDGQVFDVPQHAAERYLTKQTVAAHVCWRQRQPCRTVPEGKILRVEVMAAAVVHWSSDGWETASDAPTRDTGLGVHFADLCTKEISAGTEIVFTFRWSEDGRWEGQDFRVTVAAIGREGPCPRQTTSRSRSKGSR